MESASETETSESTALTAVAVAVEGLKEGASQARKAAGEFVPALGRTVSKIVYTGCYGITYGMVFGGLMVGSLIPKDSAVAKGVCDGADSAVKAFTRRKEEKAPIASSEEGLAAT
jgi:putative methionine-R-sulfoxide reductase with GAF domain